MPGCEKCWWDSDLKARTSGRDRFEILNELIDARDCTPEEQCGELHVVIDWKDGTRHCVCGENTE
ncbi:hypothetical protein LCGC14_0674330 [marine sediment metagenome]|uniref:Uncharacterized protein n=1 Tax=marine sediment metagenome TaxID=412755 RepID=A0A0F9TBN3_9ZZZZ